MVQFSQTSWQEYTPANLLETLRFAPLSVPVSKDPVVYYTLPRSIEAGEAVKYTVMVGFKKISWTGIISSVNDSKITVRLENGPFRGFNASHEFIAEGSLTACYDNFSFQGFNEFPEEMFADIMSRSNLIYAVASRKDAREVIAEIESKKQTQAFEALGQSATAG